MEFGGSGFSFVELVVVLEEMGRALLCAPYFSTVALASNLLLTAYTQDDIVLTGCFVAPACG